MRLLRPSSICEGARVALGPKARAEPIALPDECACCGAPASHRLALPREARASISVAFVGYCDECAEHQSSSSSLGLALGLASLLLGVVSAAALPLLFPRLGWFALMLVAFVISSLPLGSSLLSRKSPKAPHSARGSAVSWQAGDELWCASVAYAERVGELNRGAVSREPVRESRASAWGWAGPVLGAGAACVSFFVYHPRLRIINLGSVRVEVALDGNRLISVDPTSNESPSAGASLRVPAGAHTLTVASSVDGSALGRVQVELQSGRVHLFAIGAEETCFWLEQAGYGREQRTAPSFEALRSEQHFWVLPSDIDTWFAPNPATSDPGSRSSGGLLTALRQARCEDAPAEVRSAP